MAKTRTDEELDRLLARGRLGGAARERVLSRVLDKVAPAWRSPATWALGLSLAGAAAAVLTVLNVRPTPGAFTAKGGATATGPHLEVLCIDGSVARCPAGSTLVFRVEGAEKGAFLAAYAVREGDPEGARIWYFPSGDGFEPELPVGASPQIIPRGVRIGPEQAPGRYAVHLALAKAFLSREAALDAATPSVLARSTTTLEVTP